MSAGFTSWGTAAAAAYLTDNMLNGRYSEARRDRLLPRTLSPAWPDFLAVLDVVVLGNVVVSVQERYFLPLDRGAQIPASANQMTGLTLSSTNEV